MNERIFLRLRSMFDAPLIQNNLRGLWAEATVGELLGDCWRFTGLDWAAWDYERTDGVRLEVKQSASHQTWGTISSTPRFKIVAPKGHYPDGKTWIENASGERLAHVYVFAWHDGPDQRVVEEWQFYVVHADQLPQGQKSIGLNSIKRLTEPVEATGLAKRVAHSVRR